MCDISEKDVFDLCLHALKSKCQVVTLPVFSFISHLDSVLLPILLVSFNLLFILSGSLVEIKISFTGETCEQRTFTIRTHSNTQQNKRKKGISKKVET